MKKTTIQYYYDNPAILINHIILTYGKKVAGKTNNKFSRSKIYNFVISHKSEKNKHYLENIKKLVKKNKKQVTNEDFIIKSDSFRTITEFLNQKIDKSLLIIELIIAVFEIPIIKEYNSIFKEELDDTIIKEEQIDYYIGYYPASNYRITYLWLEVNYTQNKVHLFYSIDLEKKLSATYTGMIEKTIPLELLILRKRNTNYMATILYQPSYGRNKVIRAVWQKLHHESVISSLEVLLIKTEKNNKYEFYKTAIPKEMHVLGGKRININVHSYTGIGQIIHPNLINIYEFIEGYYIGIFPYRNNLFHFIKLKIEFNISNDPMVEYLDDFTNIKGYVRFINENVLYCHLPNNVYYGAELGKGENEKHIKISLDNIRNSNFLKGVFSEVSKGFQIWASKIVFIKISKQEFLSKKYYDIKIDNNKDYNNFAENNNEIVNYLLNK